MFIRSAKLAKRYLLFAPVSAPDYLTHAQPLQRARMEYEDERGTEGFHRLFEFDLTGKDLLDLGCGFGGRTVYFKEMGARSVVGIEPDQKNVDEALAFADSRDVTIEALAGTGESIPLPSESIDVITSYDVFEHVESLPKTLAECYRVLRPGGVIYAVFPPYHHPTGGSHLHGYVSNSPAPQILFSSATLRKALHQLRDEGVISYLPTLRPTDALPQVNGTTISGFLHMLKSVPFRTKQVKFSPMKSNRFPRLARLATFGVRFPVLREAFTDRIVCVLTR
jgi:SAM-dependent methyltransferase